MSEGPEYPVERLHNAVASLESAYWDLVRENERLLWELRRAEDAHGPFTYDDERADDNGMALGPEMGYD